MAFLTNIDVFSQGKITAQGKLLLHGPLMVAELSAMPSRGREWQVFLFEQNIIFSEAVGKKTQFTNPAYIYKAHIQVWSRVKSTSESFNFQTFKLSSTIAIY